MSVFSPSDDKKENLLRNSNKSDDTDWALFAFSSDILKERVSWYLLTKTFLIIALRISSITTGVRTHCGSHHHLLTLAIPCLQ